MKGLLNLRMKETYNEKGDRFKNHLHEVIFRLDYKNRLIINSWMILV